MKTTTYFKEDTPTQIQPKRVLGYPVLKTQNNETFSLKSVKEYLNTIYLQLKFLKSFKISLDLIIKYHIFAHDNCFTSLYNCSEQRKVTLIKGRRQTYYSL